MKKPLLENFPTQSAFSSFSFDSKLGDIFFSVCIMSHKKNSFRGWISVRCWSRWYNGCAAVWSFVSIRIFFGWSCHFHIFPVNSKTKLGSYVATHHLKKNSCPFIARNQKKRRSKLVSSFHNRTCSLTFPVKAFLFPKSVRKMDVIFFVKILSQQEWNHHELRYYCWIVQENAVKR